MPEAISLPFGCILRPALPTDKSTIHRLLANLEREITASQPVSPWVNWGIGLAIGLPLLGAVLLVPTIRAAMHLLAVPMIAIALLMVVATLLTLEREWQHYWVIQAPSNDTIACAKLQQQGNYSVLYDLYVLPDWRGQGLGSELVRQLGKHAQKPLYLACLPARLPFYTRLGFAQVSAKRLSPGLQYDLGLLTRPGILALVLVR